MKKEERTAWFVSNKVSPIGPDRKRVFDDMDYTQTTKKAKHKTSDDIVLHQTFDDFSVEYGMRLFLKGTSLKDIAELTEKEWHARLGNRAYSSKRAANGEWLLAKFKGSEDP